MSKRGKRKRITGLNKFDSYKAFKLNCGVFRGSNRSKEISFKYTCFIKYSRYFKTSKPFSLAV